MQRVGRQLALLESRLVALESELALLRSSLLSFEAQTRAGGADERPGPAPVHGRGRRPPGAGADLTT